MISVLNVSLCYSTKMEYLTDIISTLLTLSIICEIVLGNGETKERLFRNKAGLRLDEGKEFQICGAGTDALCEAGKR